MSRNLFGSKSLPVVVVVLALGILGGAVLAGYHHLQRVARDHLVNLDGEILDAVAQAQQFNRPATNLTEQLRSPGEQLSLVLKISKLKDGVLGVRLFDADGKFVTAFPPSVTESTLDAQTCARLRELRPLSRFHKLADLQDFFLMAPAPAGTASNTLPLLEVSIPIHAPGQGQLLACAQLLLDGRDVALKAAAFDGQLRLEAWAVFLCGGALLAGVLVWAYRRLARANRLLEERTERLLRANHELTLAAKTGALGAVAAHLVHGLSNPLTCLQLFMSAHGEDHPGDIEWQSALAATQTMRQLVHEVVRVLGEQSTRESYEVTLEEMVQVLDVRVRPVAQNLGVLWEFRLAAQGRLANHQANIVLLILENLISNSLQVTPRGKSVRLSLAQGGEGVVCEVADEGPGFPEAMRPHLFAPCRSSKGGAGLGLAISKQLASQLEAKLELRHSGPQGSVLALTLPWAMFSAR